MKNKLFIGLFVSVFALYSCEKDELTLPAEVTLEFAMEPFHAETDLKINSGFDVDQGIITLEGLEFDGRREQGGDYFFTRNFELPLQAELHSGSANQQVSFDVPQGVYNRIEMDLSLGMENEFALRLQGRFQRGPVDEIPVVFEYSFTERIRIRAKNQDDQEQIVLKKDQPATATILMDVPFMFQLVSPGMIQSAQTTTINNEEVILITIDHNTEIFNLLAPRLEKSIRVIIE